MCRLSILKRNYQIIRYLDHLFPYGKLYHLSTRRNYIPYFLNLGEVFPLFVGLLPYQEIGVRGQQHLLLLCKFSIQGNCVCIVSLIRYLVYIINTLEYF